MKPELDFQDLSRRIRALDLPDFDLVVGIATGGTVPASLVAFHLGLPLRLMSINFRAADNSPQRPEPELLDAFSLEGPASRILLVDDVSVTGSTFARAREQLQGHEVTTLAFKGKADHVLVPEVSSCVVWPWKPEPLSGGTESVPS